MSLLTSTPALKRIGVPVMLSVIAAVLIAQAHAPTPRSGWHWDRVYGQPVQVWSIENKDGSLTWGQDWNDPRKVAPVEWRRRRSDVDGVARRPGGARNYGVMAQELAADGRTLRASDAETLRAVSQEAAKKKPSCPDDSCEPEKKPGPIQRAELEVEKLVLYAVAGCLILAAAVLVFKTDKSATV